MHYFLSTAVSLYRLTDFFYRGGAAKRAGDRATEERRCQRQKETVWKKRFVREKARTKHSATRS